MERENPRFIVAIFGCDDTLLLRDVICGRTV